MGTKGGRKMITKFKLIIPCDKVDETIKALERIPYYRVFGQREGAVNDIIKMLKAGK